MPNRKRGDAHKTRVAMLAEMPDQFTTTDLAERWGLDYDQAHSVLRYMTSSGLTVKEGNIRSRIYRKVKDVGIHPVVLHHHNPTASAPNGLAGLFFRYG